MSSQLIKILRVGSYPTKERNGMGYHSYMITPIENTITHFLIFKNDETKLKPWEHTTVESSYWYNEVRPRDVSILRRLIFYFKRLIGILRFTIKGIFRIFSFGPNIVHIHSPMLIGILVFAKILRKKTCITFHGTDFHRIKNALWYKALGNRVIDELFCISPDMIPKLKNIHNEKYIHQVYNGYDQDVFVNRNKKRKKQFIAVGSLKSEKGFKYLIDAFADFKAKKGLEYKLWIAGEGKLRKEFESQIDKLGLSKDVNLIGHVDRAALVDLYNQSEFFVLSSISEGFPKVILEAMGSGCKIVTTSVGAIPEILKNYKYTVPIKSAQKLSDAFVSIINENEEYFNFYTDVLGEYSWSKSRNIYQKIYNKLNDKI